MSIGPVDNTPTGPWTTSHCFPNFFSFLSFDWLHPVDTKFTSSVVCSLHSALSPSREFLILIIRKKYVFFSSRIFIWHLKKFLWCFLSFCYKHILLNIIEHSYSSCLQSQHWLAWCGWAPLTNRLFSGECWVRLSYVVGPVSAVLRSLCVLLQSSKECWWFCYSRQITWWTWTVNSVSWAADFSSLLLALARVLRQCPAHV